MLSDFLKILDCFCLVNTPRRSIFLQEFGQLVSVIGHMRDEIPYVTNYPEELFYLSLSEIVVR